MGRSWWGVIASAATVALLTACSASTADAPTMPSTIPVDVTVSTSLSVHSTTLVAPSSSDPTVTSKTAAPFEATGDGKAICGQAVTSADPNHSTWEGIVLDDALGESTRWLFCYGDAASGQGVIVLVSKDPQHWLMTPLGFGLVNHAGDAPSALVFSATSASVTYDSLIRGQHGHAFTSDGGQTWTTIESHKE